LKLGDLLQPLAIEHERAAYSAYLDLIKEQIGVVRAKQSRGQELSA